MKTLETKVLSYELEIEIEADPQTVWRSLVDETDAWWLPDFHMVGAGSRVTFDPVAGGQLVERAEAGGSLLWYTVQMSTPGSALHLVGHVAQEWGGPATTMLRLSLEKRGSGTVLAVRDSLFGHVTEEGAASLRAGWAQLFGEGLKPHAERG